MRTKTTIIITLSSLLLLAAPISAKALANITAPVTLPSVSVPVSVGNSSTTTQQPSGGNTSSSSTTSSSSSASTPAATQPTTTSKPVVTNTTNSDGSVTTTSSTTATTPTVSPKCTNTVITKTVTVTAAPHGITLFGHFIQRHVYQQFFIGFLIFLFVLLVMYNLYAIAKRDQALLKK